MTSVFTNNQFYIFIFMITPYLNSMKKLIALLLVFIYAIPGIACTTFLLSKNGQHVFGRNYDWVSGNGMMVINKRGIKKTSFQTGSGQPVSWVSSCGSITFNQWGKDFPTGGMNEKGLVVELMWLEDTDYPSADKRPALNVLQWIQYQLDNCATIDDVIATDAKIRISNEGFAPLHYLIADASGRAATIEFLKGTTIVTKGKELTYPVLTNSIYSNSLHQTGAEVQKQSAEPLQFRDNSIQRFATACSMVQQFQQITEPPVAYAFKILNRVAQGSFTKWRIVYDITARQIHYATGGNGQPRGLSFSDFDFSCNGITLASNLNDGTLEDNKNSFRPLTFDENKRTIEVTERESHSQITIPKEVITRAANYFLLSSCN